jgi:hypothetical protein
VTAPENPLKLAGVSRATVSPDGESVGLSLVDLENHEYDVSLTYEGLGRTIVKLLAVAETAGAQRRNSGKAAVEAPLPHADALVPFPVARYALGLSEDGARIVLRLVSDNDLIWDFVLPLEGLPRLQHDLSRLETLSRGETTHD